MPNKLLPTTARKIDALKKEGEYYDRHTPGFGLRISSGGHKSFFIRKRRKGGSEIIRFALDSAKFPITDKQDAFEEARDEARRLLKLVATGGDPRQEEKQRLAAQQRKRANSFRAVAEDFIRDKLPDERSGTAVEREIRRELLDEDDDYKGADWGLLPITEITDEQVAQVVKARASKLWRGKKTKTAAKNLLALIKRLFTWAIEQRAYGIKTNPAATIRASTFAGDAVERQRDLLDDELFALWRAAKRMGYPHGRAYQLLLLSGVRLNEAADASPKELKPKEGKWVIPASRMKGRNGKARPHVVPLTKNIAEIFAGLYETEGKYLFSTDLGETPTWLSGKVKRKLDRRMLRTLRALAKRRGDNPDEVELPHWQNHDIRRTVRTRLSRLKISERAREEVLAHVPPKIQRTYDVHDYLDEKREALELWAAALLRIVEPPADNVTRLRA
jgi:hypothetical protein